LELPNPKRQMIRLSEIVSGSALRACIEAGAGDGQGHHRQSGGDRPGARAALLVAGTTGFRKSVAVNAMILSMFYKATPEDVRLIMIDPKMLELSVWRRHPAPAGAGRDR
jgi:S-DNA-T family DNA segregation ATPase FtsK/SpoIIIE